jgi:hypothetical protein
MAFVLALTLSYAVVSVIYGASVSKDVLRDWANKNDYTILTLQRRHFLRGPFFFCGNRCHVFRILIEDQSGRTHRGWFCCYGFWTGILNSNTHVKWDNCTGPTPEGT